MFFLIAKTLGVMAEAPQIFYELLIVGVALLWTRWNRAGRIVTTVMAVVVLVFAITPISSFLVRPLEDRFPQPDLTVAPTGIIVLGGAMDEGVTRARKMPALNDAAERLTEPVALMRRFPDARLIFSGGSGRLTPAAWTESDVARMLWKSLGVPDDRMSFEDKSRDTWENAVFTRELARPKPGERWLLVTSAMHMPRSVGIFRKIGFDVIPYPVDYQTGGVAGDFVGLRKPADTSRGLQAATHEWIGLVSYWLSGKTSALFPGP
ncbi:MAG: YdcF family protein [Rhodoblastus sp.]|nr:YdcF family protein [Rhodoblastus sp.]